MSTLVITANNVSDLNAADETTDVLIDFGVSAVDGSIKARHLVTPPHCPIQSNTVIVGWAEVHADFEVFGPARFGGGVFMGDLRCHHGLSLSGDLFVNGDLIITGGEMVTDHNVIVKGKARFDYRPSGSGSLYCDDAAPCGPDGH